MAENNFGKGIKITSGFDLSAKLPLDNRYIVKTLEERDAHVTNNRAYEGMSVYVLDEKKVYIYNGTEWTEQGGISDEQLEQLTIAYQHSQSKHVTIEDLHTHDNKSVLDGITSDKVTEWNNKSTFDGNYNSLTNKPNIPSIEGLATEDYVNQEINKIDVTDQLTDYAKKTEIPTKTSQLTNDSGFLTSVPSEYINETELQTHTDQVLSAGEQLVLNGSQTLQNNYNFSQLTYDGTVANNSGGSLLGGVGKRQDIVSDFFFANNPNKPTYASFDAKGAVGSTMYAYVGFYDVDKNPISASHHMYQANTLTRLTQDLKNGDTVVYLEDLTNWKENLTANHQKSFIFWNYTNKKGYTYPVETYSRNMYQNLYTDASSIDKVNNTITLSSAWSKGTIPAGTYLSQGSSGNNYKYIRNASIKITTEWKTLTHVYEGIDYSGTNSMTMLPPGTAFAKFGMFLNYNGVVNEKVWVTNITVKEDVYSAIEKKADKTELHNHSNKTALDEITSAKITEWNNKSTFDGNYNSLTNKPSIPSIEGLATENYVNDKVARVSVDIDYESVLKFDTDAMIDYTIAVVGEVDENNVITLWSNVLSDGLYTLRYSNGHEYADIGTVFIGELILTKIEATKVLTTYTEGDTLNTDDIIVKAFYNDGTSKNISNYTLDISSIKMDTPGNYQLIITYENMSTNIAIKVKEKATIKGNLFVASTCTTGKRLNSTGELRDQTSTFLTDFIEIGECMSKGGTNIIHWQGFHLYKITANELAGVGLSTLPDVGYRGVAYYDATGKFLGQDSLYVTEKSYDSEGNYQLILNATYSTTTKIRIWGVTLPPATSVNDLQNCKLTLNQLISEI